MPCTCSWGNEWGTCKGPLMECTVIVSHTRKMGETRWGSLTWGYRLWWKIKYESIFLVYVFMWTQWLCECGRSCPVYKNHVCCKVCSMKFFVLKVICQYAYKTTFLLDSRKRCLCLLRASLACPFRLECLYGVQRSSRLPSKK